MKWKSSIQNQSNLSVQNSRIKSVIIILVTLNKKNKSVNRRIIWRFFYILL